MLSSRRTTTTTNTKKKSTTHKKKQGKAAIVHSFRIAQQGWPLYIQCFPMCHLAVLDGCLERDNEVYLEADYTSFVAPRCSILLHFPPALKSK